MKTLLVNRKVIRSILTVMLLICVAQFSSYVAAAPTVTVSTPVPLTEANLDGSVVTLALSGGTYERFIFAIRDAVKVSGVRGVSATTFFGVKRVSDTEMTVELVFDGNIDSDTTLTFTISAGAIAEYNGPALTAQLPITAVAESVVASTALPLTEANLDGSVVTLALSGRTYERFIFAIRDAVKVSGIKGVSATTFGVKRVSDTEVSVELAFTGNIDSDATLTFTIGAGAIAEYNGPALTAQLPITAVAESVVASTALPLTEANLDGSVVTLTLSSRTYERNIRAILDVVTVSGIPAVAVKTTSQSDEAATQSGEDICQTDDVLAPGESCTYPGTDGKFSVLHDGRGQVKVGPLNLTADRIIDSRNITVNNEIFNFLARNRGGSWVIEEAGHTVFGVARVSDTEVSVELAFTGNIDTDATLIFTIGAGAIAGYDGPPLKAEITVTPDAEVPEIPEPGQTGDRPTQLAADVNKDGTEDFLDLVFVASRYGQTGQNPADLNGDNVVDILDLLLVVAALDTSAAAPALHPDSIEMLTAADVRKWLSHAHSLNLTDATFRRGVLVLEQLLTVLTPKETLLLPNYPNPFNPETWIPYRLAKPGDVQLTIYAMDGHVVRRLVLGHQPAGIYQTRSRAAYWDGRNAFGEPVASGIYFYTLTVGEFTATRKMMIRK